MKIIIGMLQIVVALFLSFSGWSQCDADAGDSVSICIGSSVTLDASLSSGTGVLTYVWSPAIALSCTDCANPIASPSSTTSYTLTITDEDNCSSTATVDVVVNTLPNSNFTFSQSNACANVPVSFTPNTVLGSNTYSWDFGNPASGASNSSFSSSAVHEFVSYGNGSEVFPVGLTVTNEFGCSASSIQNVTISSIPQAILTDPMSDFKNCDGTDFNVTLYDASVPSGNSHTIIWGDGTPNYTNVSPPIGGVSHTYNTADIFDLYYIVSNTNNCSDTVHYLISNITNPAIGAANPGATTGCGPINLCFPLSNYTNNHPSTYYIVDYGDGSPVDTIQHADLPPVICHEYSTSSCGQPGNAFTFVIQAENPCDISIATVNPIRVYTAPQPSFSAPQNACVNTNVSFNSTTVTGYNSACQSTTLYQWDFGDGTTTALAPTLANVNHFYTTPGTYTVTLVTQNNCGSHSYTREICIENVPNPQFTFEPAEGCVPFNPTINNTSDTTNFCDYTINWTMTNYSNSCPIYSSASWTYANGTSAQSWEPELQINATGVYTMRLALQNSCGVRYYSKTVTGNDVPLVTLTAPATVCEDQLLTPTISVNNCYAAITEYDWDLPGANPSSATTQSPGPITYENAGVYAISVDVTNICGTTEATRNITVNAPPVADAGPDVSYCTGQMATIGTAGVEGVTYAWSPTTNLPNWNQATTAVNMTNTTAAPVVREYVLTASISSVCLSRDTVLVTVNPLPIFTLSNGVVCNGDTVSLLATSAAPNLTFSWTSGASLSCDDCPNPNAWPTANTTYNVTGTNEFGCVRNVNTTVTVNPLPVVNAGLDRVLCDQPIPFTLTGTPAGGVWSGSTNVTATGIYTPNGEVVEDLVYSYTHPTTGCENTDTMQITVSPPVKPTVKELDSLCVNTTAVLLQDFLEPMPTGGVFSINGTNYTSFNPASFGTGTYSVIYTFGTLTCASSDTAIIVVNPQPTINLVGSTICNGEQGTVLVSSLDSEDTFLWTANPFLSCSDCPNPTASPSATTNFTVTATSTSGCTRSGNTNIVVNPLPVVNAGPDLTLCDQPISVQLVGTPSGGTWSGSPNVAASGTFLPDGSETAVLTYSYTNPSTNCTNTDQMQVVVSPPVVPTFNQPVEICVNDGTVNLNTLLDPQPSGGTWAGTGVSGLIFNPIITGAGTHEVTYTFGTGTCQTVIPVNIIVRPQPQLNANNAVICWGESISLEVTSSLPNTNFTWAPAASLSCADCANPVATPTATQTYGIVAESEFGCSNTISTNVTVNPLPIVNAGADTTLCNQAIGVQLNGTIAGGTWTGPMITSAGLFTPINNGNFTVSYTVVNTITGCVNSDVKEVHVIEPQLANAGVDLEACIENTTGIVVGSPVGGTWSGSGISATGEFSLASADTLEFVYTYGTGNCLTRDTMEFVVHPLPIVVGNPDVEMCISDDAIILTGSPLNGTYSGTGITDATTGLFNAILAGEGSHAITYTFIEPATTCVNSDVFDITVRPLPIIVFRVDSIVCLNEEVQFTNESTLIQQSAWDFGDGNTSSEHNPIHVYTQIGTYDVSLVVTTEFGCQDTLTKSVIVYDPPVVSLDVTPDSLCGPLLASFINNSSGPDISYAWDFGNGTTGTEENPNQISYPAGILADTSYSITLSVSNLCGTVTAQKDIIVMPQPVALFGTNYSSFCSPWTPVIVNTSYGLPDEFAWDFGNGTIATISDSIFELPVFVADPDTSSYTLTLTATNECGTDTATHTITVVPNNIIPFFNTSVTEGCTPLSVDFTQYTLGGTNYSWDLGDGTQTSDYSPSHVYTEPGTYSVSLMANNGCSYDTTTVEITVYQAPNLGFNYEPDSVCVFVPFQFINESEPSFNFNWNFGDGNTSNLFNPTHAYANSGNYNVTLTGVSLDGFCTTFFTDQIYVNVPPVANFTTGLTVGCVPVTVNYVNQSSGHAYSFWNFGDGNTSANVNAQHTFNEPGVYITQLIVQSLNGCTDTMTRYINVNPYPIADFDYHPTTICGPDATVNFVNNSAGAVDFEWNLGDGSSSTLNSVNHSYLNPGTYNVQLIATNEFGCSDTLVKSFVIHHRPEPSFTISTLFGCQNAVISFNSTSNFTDSIQWNLGDGSLGFGNEVDHVYSQPGNYTLSIIAFNSVGCSTTFTYPSQISIMPAPLANFTYQQNLDEVTLATIEFTNHSTGHSDSYWDFGNGESSNDEDPTHDYVQHGEYEVMLIVTNPNGCTDTTKQIIKNPIIQELYVPNALYPGHSSYEVSHFLPKGIGLKSYHLEIYDDWGNLIWETTQLDEYGRPSEGWDGTYRDAPVQQDAYVWKISAIYADDSSWYGKEFPNGKVKQAGTVTIIR